MGENSVDKSLFRTSLRIKEEVLENDSQGSSKFAPQNEGATIIFDSGSKVKQETSADPSARLNALMKAHVHTQKMIAILAADISKLQTACDQNFEKQAMISEILKEETAVRLKNYKPPNEQRVISIYAASYFRDTKKMVAPLNEDTKIKIKNCDVNAYLRPPRPWMPLEYKKLLDGITAYALMTALKPHKTERDRIKEKLKDKDILDFEIEILKRNLAQAEKKIRAVSEKSLQELLPEIQGKIDWLAVSSIYMEGIKKPDECENMWTNFLDFSISKEVFSKEEDEKLLDLAEDNNEREWDLIAAELRTNRTPIQCFERYQTRLKRSLQRKFWTKEEDERLSALVNEMKCGEIIPWNRISLLMEGRTRQQCINRYERSISQTYNRGPWTTEEDAVLVACYHKFGQQWAKMKDFFKRRSTYSIRERYVNALDPSVKMGSWSKDEDMLLISLIRQIGYGKWSKICKKVPGRTDNMCMVRAGRLLEYSVIYYSDKGIEIDPGINDPELFAKILKPLAPSKPSLHRNNKLRAYREDAFKLLVKVLEKIDPYFKCQGDVNSADFSWLSTETLNQISEELHYILFKREKEKEEKVLKSYPRIRYFSKPALRRKRNYDEEDSEVERPVSPTVQTEINVDKERLECDMSMLLNMQSKIEMQRIKRKPKAFTTREIAEMLLYKAYLYKQLSCQALCDEGDDIENVTFNGIDYSQTLQTVVSFFIQPPTYEQQPMIIAPNVNTIGGMEIVEITEDRLQSMSECVSHSKNYIDYICERRKSCPKCLQCVHKEARLQPKVNSVVENMRSKHFLMSETMETHAYVEGASTEKCVGTCSCTSLQESRNAVQLLRKRFMALFLWPALLGSTTFSKEQEEILCTKNTNKDYFLRMKEPSARPKRKGRPRGSTNKPREDLPGAPPRRKVGRPRKIKTEPIESTELPAAGPSVDQNELPNPTAGPSVDQNELPNPTAGPSVDQNELPNPTAGPSVDQNELPNPATTSDSLPAPEIVNYTAGEATSEVEQANKRKSEDSRALRRSKRVCVLSRTSFGLPTLKKE